MFLFSSLSLSFHSPPVSPCIALFDKGKEFTIKAQEGKRVRREPFTTSASPLEADMGTNVPAALLESECSRDEEEATDTVRTKNQSPPTAQ